MEYEKKILIVGRSFYPDISPRSFRTTELAKEFARQGHNVTVLTHKVPEHTDFEKEYKLTIKDLGKSFLRDINIDRRNKLFGIFFRILKRGLNLFLQYPQIELTWKVAHKLKKERGYDLLISIASPHTVHWGVAKVWGKNQKIAKLWVADCGDPFMGSKTDSFRKMFYFKYIEKWFSRKTDYISITKEEFKVNYYPEFHYKIVEIPQGFRFEDVTLYPGGPANKIPHFAFAGTLIKGTRDPDKFLLFLSKLNFNFKMILYTKQVHLIKSYLDLLKGKIEIRDYIPRLNLIYELSKMDFLVNFEYDPVLQSPSKLIDYALTKRPIINITSKNFDTNVIWQFLSGDYSNQFIIPDLDKYRIENVCARFLALIKDN